MYSPGRGDARATAPPNARDSSTSMPIDHASAWQRESYNRDMRLDRGDRDRIIGGKREWNSDRPSSGAPYHRAFGGLHPVNGSLGPQIKRRVNGRHSGFHIENGRYGSAGHRGEPSPFGSIPPLENGLARKFDRDFYPGSGCPVTNTGFSNGPGLDHRSKDLDERHKRESFIVSVDSRDGGSSVSNDQSGRPYHSQVLSEVENTSWERDRSKGLVSSGSWDSSQRSERDHRERLSGKPDSYSRREGKFSQYDSGRDWSQGEKDLDGSRLDRYGSSSRDGFSGDTLGGTKDSLLGFDWRRKERSSSVSASRSTTYIPSNGGSKESAVRPQGLDVSVSLPSPPHSPQSTPSSTVHEPPRDDGNQPSPPKRPRLGWGQGLAKYEKKKVVETDEIFTPSSGGTASDNGRSVVTTVVSSTTTEGLQSQELHAAEESPVSVVSNPTTLCVSTPTPSPLQQALESVSKSTVDSQSVGREPVVVKLSEKIVDEAERPVACFNPPCEPAENVVKGLDACTAIERIWGASVRQLDSSESVDKPTPFKEPSICEVSPSSPSLIEQSSVVDISQEVSSNRDAAVWTKEDILLRVEKVESEIELVERELLRLEKFENGKIAVDRELAEDMVEVKSEQCDDGPQAMDEDEVETSPPIHDSRESSQLVHVASPTRNSCSMIECTSNIHGEGALVDGLHEPGIKSVESEDGIKLDPVAVLEEGELHEEKIEEVGMIRLLHDFESDASLMSSPSTEADLPHGEHMNHLLCLPKSEVEDKEESNKRMIMLDFQPLVSTLMEENKRQSQQASQPFLHLFSQDLFQEGKIYSCPVESPVWNENVESHERRQEMMLGKISEQQHSLKFTRRILTMRFRALKDAWRQEQFGVSQLQRGTKPVRRWELDKRNGAAPPCHRSSLRLRTVQPGMGKLEAVSEEYMKKLIAEPVVGQLRPALKMPAMILGERERLARRFVSKNALVEDPVMVELERKCMNPWSADEKKMFLEKFALYNKNFSKISAHLEYKTTADCVEFYYRNQKSEDFEKIRRRQQLKKRRDYSRVRGSYLATGLPTSSRQREANAHARVEAFNGQAAPAVVTVSHISVGAKAVRSSIHHKPLDRMRTSSSLDPACLPLTVELGKSLSGKESKSSGTPPVAACAAGFAAVVGTISSAVTVSCSLSSATQPHVKISRERSSVKTVSSGVQVTRSGPMEQHTSGPKGARSMHIRRDLVKSAGEEADAQWTDRERELFKEAVAMFGKNFQSIALHVGSTKSLGQCKSFFSKTRKRLGLDQLVEKYQAILRSSAEAALVKNLECVDSQMEEASPEPVPEVLHAVSEDGQVSSLKKDNVSNSMEEENLENKSSEDDELEEEIANALELPDPRTIEEETAEEETAEETVEEEVVEEEVVEEIAVEEVVVEEETLEPAATAIFTREEAVETSVCLTESVANVECGVAVTVPTVDEFHPEEPEESTPALIETESEHVDEQLLPQVPKVEKTEEMPLGSESTSIAASVFLEEGDVLEAPNVAENVFESLNCESEAGTDNNVALEVKISNPIVDEQEPKPTPTATVKPEPGSPQVALSASTDSASFPSVTAALSHCAGAIFSTTSSIQNAQPVRERIGRVGPGETKARREPTSWTQEEKEKFADIIRNHGKDWTRLQDCLPAKSLTQIKTYFQNSKAKLGLLNPEGLNISIGRGAGSRKRKADDSDTSSNNVGSLTTTNELKSGSVLPTDVDVVSQKVNSAMAALPSMAATMNVGTGPVGVDNLPYSLFNPRMEDPMTVQKFIRQMCNANGFAQNSQGLYPFLQHGLPLFPNPGLQRTPHSNLQQQLAASLSQKSSQSVGLQQPLQSPGVQHNSQPNLHQQAAHQLQTAQVARSQQQLLQNMMQQQAAHLQQQQQHQTSKGVLHPLQQQVVVLQQGQQQQQHLLNQQVVHHPQAQQASSQQQQAAVQQMGNQSLLVGNPPQVTNQFKHLHQQQQQVLFQQQQQHQFQQAVKQLQQQQLQLQQEQAQAQAQSQAQAQAQAQAHAHIHQHQNSHSPLLQPLGATKPKGIVPLPQQLTKTLSAPVLQQGVMLHRNDQMHHGPAQTLLRGNVQNAVSSNSGEISNHQEEMVELRGSNSNGGASKRREFSRASIEQKLSAAVQRVNPSPQQALPQRSTQTSPTESQQTRPGDVKLFGQSLLCQPNSTAATQTAARHSVPCADRVSLQQPPVYTPSSSSVTSMSVPAATGSKMYGKDSAFRGVPYIPDGRQAAWPPLANQGNMGIWNLMNGMHSQVSPVPKCNDGELELHSMQETRLSRELRDGELEQAMPSFTHKIQHLEQSRGVQEHSRVEGLSTMVHGLDKPRASLNDQGGVGAPLLSSADISRPESDRRNDTITHASSGSERGSMTASRTSRGQSESFGTPTSGSPANTQQVPRTVINALMAIADWHQSRSLQSHSSIGQPRLDDHQLADLVRQGLAAANGAAVDALKANPALGLAASLPAPQPHLSGNDLLQQCGKDGGMYFTHHYPNLAGHTGVSSSAWNSGAGPSDVQRMLVNPALTSFLPGALSRAPTATEEHLGSTESRDPDGGGGGVG